MRAVFDPSIAIHITHHENKSVLSAAVPLRAVGQAPQATPLARLDVSVSCCLGSSGTYLAVANSKYALVAELDRTPIIRFEYDRDAEKKPGAHIQVHAERGALTHLLSRNGVANPHNMASLHLPVGGDRFRPSLEDVVEFLVVECGYESRPGWNSAVQRGRADYRKYQLASAIRDNPSEAVRSLRRLGYAIESPGAGDPPDNGRNLGRW